MPNTAQAYIILYYMYQMPLEQKTILFSCKENDKTLKIKQQKNGRAADKIN